MKTRLLKGLFILLCLPVTIISNAQWSADIIPHFRTGKAVWAINRQNAAIAGGNETNDSIQSLFISNDRTLSWNINLDAVKPWLTCVQFIDVRLGFAAGESGTIVLTKDSGNTWLYPVLPGNAAVRSYNGIFFVSASTGYVVGGNLADDSIQTILATTDSGNTWAIQRDVPGPWLKAIYFSSTNIGYAVGNHGAVLKTTNAGATWNPLALSGNFTNRNYNAVHFINDMVGFIVGGYPANDSIETILKTTDGGTTWNSVMDQPGPMFNSICFASTTKAYIAGNKGIIMESSDAGNTWSRVSLPVAIVDTMDLNGVSFADTTTGIIVGKNGVMIKYLQTLSPSPVVNTLQATNVTASAAQLNGTVVPNSNATNVWFEYGLTPSLGDTVFPSVFTVSGNSPVPVQAQINSLLPNSFYYYRLDAINNGGVATGNIQQAYTSDCEIPDCDFEVWDTTYITAPAGWSVNGIVVPVPSYDGTLAAQIASDSIGDSGSGVIYGIAVDSGFTDWHPFSGQPDSVLFHIKYNIVANDTGFFILFLKDAQSNVNTIYIPITGTSSGNWVAKEALITYPNNFMPDSVIIGITNTNVFIHGASTASILDIDNISFRGDSVWINNSDLNLWDSLVKQTPHGWRWQQKTSSTAYTTSVAKSQDCVSGRYALLLTGQSNTIGIGKGAGSDSLYYSRPAFPVAGRHISFNFFAKFDNPDNVTANILVKMFSGGVVVGTANVLIDTSIQSYTALSSDIIYYPVQSVPDSANIQINIMNSTNANSTAFYLDNLSFDGFRVAGLNNINLERQQNLGLTVYPDPASDIVNVKWNNIAKTTVQVLSLAGNEVYSNSLTGNKTTLNVNKFAAGAYMIKIISGDTYECKKIEVVK